MKMLNKKGTGESDTKYCVDTNMKNRETLKNSVF